MRGAREVRCIVARCPSLGAWLLLPVLAAPCAAAVESAELAYRARCAVCHDSGAGQAPRLADRPRWKELAGRGRTALYGSAINGVPNTPMVAKGGFMSLTDQETRAIVDFMLAATGNADAPLAGAPRPAPAAPHPAGVAAAGLPVPATDAGLAQAVAERLRAVLGKPEMRLDPYQGVIAIRGVGFKVEVRDGVTILAGVIDDASLIARAEEVAAAVPGVTRIINRMVAAAMFDFD